MQIIKYFKNPRCIVTKLSLSRKITLFIYVTSLVVFLGMGVVIYSISNSFTNKTMINDGTDFCGTGAKIAENACSYLKGVADYCSADSSVQRLLSSQPSDDSLSTFPSYLFSLFQSRKYILSIIFYNPAGFPVQYMAIDGSSGPRPQSGRSTFEQLMSGTDYIWEFIDSDSSFMQYDNSPKLSLWHLIRSSSDRRIVGAVCVSIDSRLLLRYELPYTRSYYREFSILDSQTSAIASDYSGYLVNSEDASLLLDNVPPGSKSGYFPVTLNRQGFTAFYQQILSTPLYIYYLVPDSRGVAYSQRIFYTIGIAVSIYLLLILPILTIITRWLTKPLAKLMQSMDQFSEGDFDIRLSFNTDDEIGRLGKAFNKMVEKNKRLIEQNYVAQIKAKEAELLLLQAQINPHFIYNLINSIQWSALRHGEKDIADTAYSLGQIFRISLNRGNNMIAVSRECDLVNYYLTLQKARYKDRLQFTIFCDDAAKNITIPKLIIQPLVENSVVHGVEPSLNTTNIGVRVYLEGRILVIEIEDDGIGIPPDILAKLPDNYAPPESSQSSGFAIKNIFDRLKLLYSDNFSYQITSELGCGTRIRITLPADSPSTTTGKEEQNV